MHRRVTTLSRTHPRVTEARTHYDGRDEPMSRECSMSRLVLPDKGEDEFSSSENRRRHRSPPLLTIHKHTSDMCAHGHVLFDMLIATHYLRVRDHAESRDSLSLSLAGCACEHATQRDDASHSPRLANMCESHATFHATFT